MVFLRHIPNLFIPIKRVLNVCIREAPFNPVEALLFSKRDVIDLERVVKHKSLAIKYLHDVSKRMVCDVEVAWNSLNFNETLKATTLLQVKLLSYAIVK